MAFEDKRDLHTVFMSLIEGENTRMFNAFTKSKKDSKDGPKAEFTWAEAQMTTRGMEVYALKSDTPLVENTKILSVDLLLSRIFHSVSEINIFFDTEGYLGRTRIYFTFSLYTPVAFAVLKSLMYKILHVSV
ncbi:hypothetical protein Anas_13468 [Armadillidium nasatum]|uniref:Uncharacterized protein n=1 Tax=Armadillidium nasatum TaxID=96803 RepID=A0A5N5SUJ2_9CRUS|nr:hypothetical protein Anas_13468 [Armadillidium nasatum]